MLTALAMVPAVVLATASPAAADTSQFRGFNWAVLGDNFVEGPLVLDKLSQSDGYDTVRAKADAIYADMASTMGANTVRLPVNTHTVGTTWWNAYRGAIDAATARGFKVILAYWEDGAASGGRITNMSAFNAMWNTVTSQYGSNSLVYFEPMNEPHGYSASEWTNVAASWISSRPSVPKGRILIGGTGYSQDVKPVCADSRLDGTLLSYHHYAFFYGTKDYAGWVQSFRDGLGSCASRAVLTEFGAPMDNGLNYADAASTDNFVRHIRAVTDTARQLNMGSTYWPALGGKITGNSGYDWYSMFAVGGSGTNLDLTIRNPSGADRIRHGWGDDVGGGSEVTDIVSRVSGKCVDVVSGSTANGAEIIQYDCHGRVNQQWELRPVGSGYVQIVSQASGKCLDVNGASTANNAKAIQWTCGSGTNQQWQVREAGGGHVELVARHSGKCLDVTGSSTANSARLQQYDCYGGTNQHWTL
ncbi:RICIN domain-containing protein [Glycomyces sp. TRM65418]|uniref:RICIN domain-containing protein n=1 Tax=Glycomyces sp. TRM65418 TaxID=2867006 RepID=UPI001CE682CF|nr:RICIN domain-containing protein [Glycomyces sp. TRM65418]MCC3763338.1 RICIN domain-containing protein [Glycomyces sp. TRM65418]QZD57335.1 RICIN domain-containing protein [Glycomyces sp. TRM65418]